MDSCFYSRNLRQLYQVLKKSIRRYSTLCIPVFSKANALRIPLGHILDQLFLCREIFVLLLSELSWHLLMEAESNFNPVSKQKGQDCKPQDLLRRIQL